MRTTTPSHFSFFQGVILFLTVITVLGTAGIAGTRDTTVPNEFAFTSDVYYAEEDATNAVITVNFYPGNRSWWGSVDYYTEDGSATAGLDYTAVQGTLTFSGPGTPVPEIVIPIAQGIERTHDKTVLIFLSNPSANITRGTATLVIPKKASPLNISPGSNGTIVISWPQEKSGLSLQKSASLFGSEWVPVSAPPSVVNGFCKVIQPASGAAAFYRLEKTAAP